MGYNQKILIGAIIGVLLLSMGTYAVSQSNTADEIQTPPPVPGNTTIPVPTIPMPTPTAEPSFSQAPTATPTPTPAPMSEAERIAMIGWPNYDYHWSIPDSTVYFNQSFALLLGWYGPDDIRYSTYDSMYDYMVNPDESAMPGSAQLIDGKIRLNIPVVRNGNLSKSYDVPIRFDYSAPYEEYYMAAMNNITVHSPVHFAAGQSSANLTIEYNADYLFTELDSGHYHWYVCLLMMMIEGSPDYDVVDSEARFNYILSNFDQHI